MTLLSIALSILSLAFAGWSYVLSCHVRNELREMAIRRGRWSWLGNGGTLR
jgi:hypothetical protein